MTIHNEDPLFKELKYKFKNKGISPAERQTTAEKIFKQHLSKISKYANLSDICKENIIFNHGAWFVFGSADYDPLLDFVYENNIKGEIFHIYTTQPIFSNLGKDPKFDIDWDRTVVCCEKSVWPKLESFLMQVAFIEHNKAFFFQTTLQQLPIADINIKNEIPIKEPKIVNIKIFGLDSNKGLVIARKSVNGLLEFALAPAKNSTVELAKSILNYKSNDEVADKMDQSYREEKQFLEQYKSQNNDS